MKHTSQFIHARLVLVISIIKLLRCICSYLSLVGLAWTSWNQWPHPQRWAAPFFRFIHIIKVLSSSPAHTHTHAHQKMKMDRCNTAFPGLPYSNLRPLINLLLLNIASLGIMSSILQLAITHVTNLISRSSHHRIKGILEDFSGYDCLRDDFEAK